MPYKNAQNKSVFENWLKEEKWYAQKTALQIVYSSNTHPKRINSCRICVKWLRTAANIVYEGAFAMVQNPHHKKVVEIPL